MTPLTVEYVLATPLNTRARLISCSKILLLWVAIFSGVSTAWALDNKDPLNRGNKLDKIILQLKWTHAFQFAGYYAAKAQGYYAAAGLDVDIVEAAADTDTVGRVLDGQAHYGVGSSNLLLERAAGKPVVALAVIFQQSPYQIFTSSKITDLQALRGKRIMLEPQSQELLALLLKKNAPLAQMQQLPHSFDARSLMSGAVDAMSGYMSDEPFYFMQAGYSFHAFSPRSVGIDFYGDNLFTSEQELNKHPARAKAFRAASLRGWQYAKSHPEEIIDLILAHYSQKRSRAHLQFEVEQMVPLLQPNLIEVGYMNPARWRNIADTYASIGLLPAGFSLDGFLFDATEADNTALYRALFVVFALLGISMAIALYIYRNNQRLHASEKQTRLANEQVTARTESLATALRSLQKAESEQRQLLSMASHEFRTPAAVIKASLDSLDYLKDRIPPEVQTRLVNIRHASERMIALSNNLIDQDRLIELSLKPQLLSVDMVPLVTGVLTRYPASAQIQARLPVSVPVIQGDAALLSIALHNLIDNALRHGLSAEGLRLPVTVSLSLQPGQLVLEVADCGVGIADDQKNKVFERFHVIHKSRSRATDSAGQDANPLASGSGSGLGLPIVQSIAQAHGGRAWVRDNPPQGAVLVLCLPILLLEQSSQN